MSTRFIAEAALGFLFIQENIRAAYVEEHGLATTMFRKRESAIRKRILGHLKLAADGTFSGALTAAWLV
jgi:hypothetical protein